MNDLVTRLEKATGPDRELDVEIARACGIEVMQGYPIGTDSDWLEAARIKGGWYKLRALTASIDAALTLVPEGWPIDKLSWWPRCPPGYEDQRVARVTIMALDHIGFGCPKLRFESVGATPAIALCIAALKARASITTGKHNAD